MYLIVQTSSSLLQFKYTVLYLVQYFIALCNSTCTRTGIIWFDCWNNIESNKTQQKIDKNDNENADRCKTRRKDATTILIRAAYSSGNNQSFESNGFILLLLLGEIYDSSYHSFYFNIFSSLTTTTTTKTTMWWVLKAQHCSHSIHDLANNQTAECHGNKERSGWL